MSFGQDPRWRRALVDAIDPRPGQRVLDVATGTGMVAFALAARGCEVVGLDQSEQMLDRRARKAPGPARRSPTASASSRGRRSGCRSATPSSTRSAFTYLLRYVDDRAATMAELARVVRPGGRIGMLEFGVPGSPPLRALWRLYTRVGLPALGRLASPAWLEVGRFLGPNIEEFYGREPDLPGLWRRAGIEQVRERRMSFGAGW